MDEFVAKGGAVTRVGNPIPYNERGTSRADVIRTTGNTVFVKGMNLPTEYLHAMDTSIVRTALSSIPRPVNESGYPLEGVHTRHVAVDGVDYLYIVNLCPDPVPCQLAGGTLSGRDPVQGCDIAFPRTLQPLENVVFRNQIPQRARYKEILLPPVLVTQHRVSSNCNAIISQVTHMQGFSTGPLFPFKARHPIARAGR